MTRGSLPGQGKYVRPDASAAVDRKRLFRLLDKGRRHSLIWVSGPAGAGKTTLVSSYVASKGLRCLWYQVDRGDTDPATFFYYLGLATRAANPRKRKSMPVLTPEYLMGVPAFTRRFFDEMFSRLKPPALMVLDNVQEAAGSPAFLDVLCEGLAHVPQGVTVVLISRGAAPKEFARLRVNGHLVELGWEDLKLTEDEARAMARKRGVVGMDIRDVHSRTAGWAAGVVLFLEGARGEVPEVFIPDNVFDYFAAEVFTRMGPATRGFLLRTAYLPSMTEAMADEVTGSRGAGRVLREMARQNYFTDRHRGAEVFYIYHPLFREFLLDTAGGELPDGELSELRQRSAAVLARAGSAEEAASLFIAEGDWGGLAGLVIEHAPGMMAQGRNRVLLGWFEAMPGGVVETNPWLLFWAGTARMPFDPPLSRENLERAFQMFDGLGDAAGVFLAWAGVVLSVQLMMSDFKPLDAWLDTLEGLIGKYGEMPPGWVEATVVDVVIFIITFRSPSHPSSEAWVQRAMALAGLVDITQSVPLYSHLAMYFTYKGDAAMSREAIDRLRSMRKAGLPPLEYIVSSLAEAIYLCLAGRADQCRRVVDQALLRTDEMGFHLLDVMLQGHAVYVSLMAGDRTHAQERIRLLDNLTGWFNPWNRFEYLFVRSLEALERGNVIEARRFVEEAEKSAEQVSTYLSRTVAGLLHAVVLDMQGEAPEARVQLESVLKMDEGASTPLVRHGCSMVGAWMALRAGDRSEARDQAEEALLLAREHGYIISHVLPPREAGRLMAFAVSEKIQIEYAVEIINTLGLLPPDDFAVPEDWPYPYRIRTLGKFEVEVNGKPIAFTGKTPKRPLAVLKALITLGGRDVPVEPLIDALWPEADGDAALRSFTAALYRLRKVLGDDRLLTLAEGRLSLDTGRCFVDARVLEQLLDRARDAGEQEREGLLERVLVLYKGDFLDADETGPWAISARERLKQRALAAVDDLAVLKEKAGLWENASALHERGLELNPLMEECYQGLMRCHLARGEYSGAARAYLRCREALNTGLGVKPSEETERLYRMAKAV